MYKLNYFNFEEKNNKYLITNDIGEYEFLSKENFKKLLQKMKLESNVEENLLKKGFIEGNMDEILSDIDQKLNKSDLKESDKGYSTYLNMREGKTDNENEILKNIWESCLYHSFLNNLKINI